jgi:hypothetical protein
MNGDTEAASDFSSEEEENVLFVPTAHLLNQYNCEYSVIVKEV